jgi:hypothetical protein
LPPEATWAADARTDLGPGAASTPACGQNVPSAGAPVAQARSVRHGLIPVPSGKAGRSA